MFVEPSEFVNDSDSNDEKHWKNDYPHEDMLQSDNEELKDDEDKFLTLENFEKSHFTGDSKKSELETDEESQDEQAGSWYSDFQICWFR